MGQDDISCLLVVPSKQQMEVMDETTRAFLLQSWCAPSVLQIGRCCAETGHAYPCYVNSWEEADFGAERCFFESLGTFNFIWSYLDGISASI